MKEIKFKKGMTREQISSLLNNAVFLEDEVYMGARYRHTWRCKCGNLFIRTLECMKATKFDCGCIEFNNQEKRFKTEVDKNNDYEYIRSFRLGEILTNGKEVKSDIYIQVKHKYCNSIYEVMAKSFIKLGTRCTNCCGSYENSFAHHIEVELEEPLDKYWDFDKNTLNPYHIGKNSHQKIWIKCQEVKSHKSYEISVNRFLKGKRCHLCHSRIQSSNKKSFAQYHIDNTDKDFLEKY